MKTDREICDAATDGKWVPCEFADSEQGPGQEWGVCVPSQSVVKRGGDIHGLHICRGMDGPTRIENATFIAHYNPAKVRAMLDEIERLRNGLAEVQPMLDRSTDEMWKARDAVSGVIGEAYSRRAATRKSHGKDLAEARAIARRLLEPTEYRADGDTMTSVSSNTFGADAATIARWGDENE